MGGSSTKTSTIDIGEQTGFSASLGGKQFSKTSQDRLDELGKTRARAEQLQSVIDNNSDPGAVQGAKSQLKNLKFDQGELDALTKEKADAKGSVGKIQRSFETLEGFVDAGPGQADIGASTEAQRELAARQKELSETGFQPTETDLAFGRDSAQAQFGEERLRLDQGFEDQQIDTASLAARLGRATDDPILQAKLRTGFMREQAALSARQGASERNIANLQPRERLGLQTAQVNTLGGLASQAFRNRSALLEIGSGLQAGERNFQLAQASRTETTKESPGALGIFGAVTGGIGSLFGGAGKLATGLSKF